MKVGATLVYGLLLEAGGLMGFLKAGSKASLAAGCALGLLAWVGAVLLWSAQPAGCWVAFAAALFVTGYFGIKFILALRQGSPKGRAAGLVLLSLAEIAVLWLG